MSVGDVSPTMHPLQVQQGLVEPDIDMFSRHEKATSRWKPQESDNSGESLKEMGCVQWLEEVSCG